MSISVRKFLTNPIINKTSFRNSDGDNICGPTLIKTPEWLPNLLGKFYLYFAHHQGQYIRLAFADELEGGWTIYEPGTLKVGDSLALCDHVASPDVHVIESHQEIRMYFHSVLNGTSTQYSFVARSRDGINFQVNPSPIANFYLRVIRWNNLWLGMSKGGEMYLSSDGLTAFKRLPNSAFKMTSPMANAYGDIRHVALALHKNGTLNIFFSKIGDKPESILRAKIDLQQPISNWIATSPELVCKPQYSWEGVDFPIEESQPGASKNPENALRDPAIFLYENKVYLMYSAAGESGIGIGELLQNGESIEDFTLAESESKKAQLLQVSIPNPDNLDFSTAFKIQLDALKSKEALAKRLSMLDGENPIKRIYVMGCGRSGTWLLTGIFSTMRNVHVIPTEVPPEYFGLYSSTYPVLVMKRDYVSYLSIDRIPDQIQIAYIVRHPYDVLTSYNPVSKTKYHIPPDRWLGEMLALKQLIEAKRSKTKIFRYEDLVLQPDLVQAEIANFFELCPVASTKEIATTFSASPEAILAMHGLRPIDINSINKFKLDPEKVRYLKTIKKDLGYLLEWVSKKWNYDIDL